MLSKSLLVLLFFGLLAGLVLSGSDIANPITRLAEAERIREETDQLIRQNEIDREYYQSLRDAQAKADAERLGAETLHLQRMNAQELQHVQERHAFKLQLFQLVSYSAALSLVLLIAGISVHIAKRPARANVGSHEHWRQVRLALQKREQEQRRGQIETRKRLSEMSNQAARPNGRQKSKRPSRPLQMQKD